LVATVLLLLRVPAILLLLLQVLVRHEPSATKAARA
jgi:hypothetical protein